MSRADWPLVLLLGPLAIAATTDFLRDRIYNWTTYPGLLLGWAVNYWATGTDGLQQAALGSLALGGLLLVCFVLFGVGGGDVKLFAMIGGWLGLEQGIEALLWTFTLGAIASLAMIIWQIGAVRILVGMWRHLRLMWRAKGWVSLTETERQPLKRELFLAPAALAAVGIMVWRRFG